MKVNRLVIHHSYSSRDKTTVAQIRSWHLALGWRDIGYHYVITGDGTLHVGRPAHMIGAHAEGYNYDWRTDSMSLGLCLTGNFMVDEPSPGQRQTLKQLLATLCKRHALQPSAIVGHRDLNQTSCPGNKLYLLIPRLRLEIVPYLLQKGA